MGSNALNNVYVQPAKTWSDWKSMVNQLTRKKELMNKFHSIAIDTADEAWNLCVKYICSQNSVENLGDIPWGQDGPLCKVICSKKDSKNGKAEMLIRAEV